CGAASPSSSPSRPWSRSSGSSPSSPATPPSSSASASSRRTADRAAAAPRELPRTPPGPFDRSIQLLDRQVAEPDPPSFRLPADEAAVGRGALAPVHLDPVDLAGDLPVLARHLLFVPLADRLDRPLLGGGILLAPELRPENREDVAGVGVEELDLDRLRP